jgi:hypothetical protein
VTEVLLTHSQVTSKPAGTAPDNDRTCTQLDEPLLDHDCVLDNVRDQINKDGYPIHMLRRG